ncbi:MAG: hypothetical protein ACK5JS_07210, partial [Mangrovibacterium sp.]
MNYLKRIITTKALGSVFSILTVLLLSGCYSEPDPTTISIIKNDTKSEVTISFSPSLESYKLQSGEEKIYYTDYGYDTSIPGYYTQSITFTLIDGKTRTFNKDDKESEEHNYYKYLYWLDEESGDNWVKSKYHITDEIFTNSNETEQDNQ